MKLSVHRSSLDMYRHSNRYFRHTIWLYRDLKLRNRTYQTNFKVTFKAVRERKANVSNTSIIFVYTATNNQ